LPFCLDERHALVRHRLEYEMKTKQQATQVTQFLLFIQDNLRVAKREKNEARVACLTLLARTVEFCSRYLHGNTE